MRKDYLVFGDLDTRDYGVWISGKGVFSPPERDYQRISVPGRNGDLLIDQGRFQNSVVPYDAFIIRHFIGNIDVFRNAVMAQKGYQRLEDTIHPEEFRMAQAMPFHVDTKGTAKAGTFTMEFDCKPQRYLKNGEIPIEMTQDGLLYNETLFDAKPLIRIYGNGIFAINGDSVEVSGVTDYVDIDSETEDASREAENMNSKITLEEFPCLKPGDNEITVRGGITKVVITPRWWIV